MVRRTGLRCIGGLLLAPLPWGRIGRCPRGVGGTQVGGRFASSDDNVRMRLVDHVNYEAGTVGGFLIRFSVKNEAGMVGGFLIRCSVRDGFGSSSHSL
mmetsp:Transcript_30758/g.48204  ORF Transcript_30758/g.48204 Transcript_30758/m.48204 type:complete len:98 (+) Transcript_30758:4116-4409(+)